VRSRRYLRHRQSPRNSRRPLGARYKGRAIGTCSPYTCFSFYPVKNITTIEGGAVTCADPDVAQRLHVLANNGLQSTAWSRYGKDVPAITPQVVAPGFKYNTNNVNAALGLAQLRKLPAFLAARRRLAERYRAVLSELEEIELPHILDGVEHAWHLLIVRLRLDLLRKSRDELAYALKQENVETRVHFVALHHHPYYRETLGLPPGALPHATAASGTILSLPLHPRLTDKNVQEVVEALRKVFMAARR